MSCGASLPRGERGSELFVVVQFRHLLSENRNYIRAFFREPRARALVLRSDKCLSLRGVRVLQRPVRIGHHGRAVVHLPNTGVTRRFRVPLPRRAGQDLSLVPHSLGTPLARAPEERSGHGGAAEKGGDWSRRQLLQHHVSFRVPHKFYLERRRRESNYGTLLYVFPSSCHRAPFAHHIHHLPLQPPLAPAHSERTRAALWARTRPTRPVVPSPPPTARPGGTTAHTDLPPAC